mmetsp:Transcript_55543/g.60145  ORF Transcript_55543/g.60145 Transcript_55543/m.60145 type:complete len:109 (+) Transcript_55543:473-799(+)
MYLTWIASEDVETQQKGCVNVAWPCENTESTHQNGNSDTGDAGDTDYSNEEEKGEDPSSWERSIRPTITKRDLDYQQLSFDCFPARFVAIHFCAQEKPIYRILGSEKR